MQFRLPLQAIIESISGDFVVTANPETTFHVKSFTVGKLNRRNLANRWQSAFRSSTLKLYRFLLYAGIYAHMIPS
jgi:hypothetical protein